MIPPPARIVQALRALLLALWIPAALVAAQGVEHVRDRVALFSDEQVHQMEDRLVRLSQETTFEVLIDTRRIEEGDHFSEVAEQVFEDIVQALGHYRVALVLIGIDRNEGHGMVGTNLGAGLFQVLTREQAADLFLAEGEAFSPERITDGVERLAARLDEWHALKTEAGEDYQGRTPRAWYQSFGIQFYPVLGVVLLVIWLGWSNWRSRKCPSCGSGLRVRVRLGGPGGAAVRTAKCFECGHVEKRRYERWGWIESIFGGRGTPES